MDIIEIPLGDKGYNVPFTIQDANGSVINLTNYTVTLKAWEVGSPSTLKINAVCTVDEAASGTCHYTTTGNENSTPGYLQGKIVLSIGSTVIETIEGVWLLITPVVRSIGLVSLAQAKNHLRIDTMDAAEDEDLIGMIEAITQLAETKTGRCFVQRSITEYHQGYGANILRLQKTPVVFISSVSWNKVERHTGDGETVEFTLGETPMSGTFTVYVDGTLQTETTDYSQSGTTLTFTSAPSDGSKIICRYRVELDLIDDYTEQLSIGRLKGSWLNGYEYVIVYTAGYATTMELAQAAVPDAKLFVLKALAFLYENRTGFMSQNISGVGSVDYGDIEELPPAVMKWLKGFSRGGLLC